METSSEKRCPHPGRHLRHLLLVASVAFLIYSVFRDVAQSRDVYVCDVPEYDSGELRRCMSPDDVESCVGLTDVDGIGSACVVSSCGYKLLPHVDVSVAGSSDPFDPRAATSPTSFLSVASMFYGIVPYVGVLYLLLFLAMGDIAYLTRLVIWGMIAVLNEEVFKNLFDQRRPTGSCLYFESYGMPSGHAATSIGLLTYLLLELFVYHPNLLCGLTCRRKETSADAYSFEWGYGWHRAVRSEADARPAGENAPLDSVVVQINEDDGIVEGDNDNNANTWRRALSRPFHVKWIHHWYALGYFLLLFPVPFSRIYLHDHTRDQVLAGSVVGAAISMVWYTCFVRTCGGKLMTGWGRSDCAKWWGVKFGGV